MKRFLCLSLLCTLLLPLCSCSLRSDGQSVCLQFLTAIADADYARAYALVDGSVKSDSEDNLEAKGKISQEQFINKYTNIFSVLGIASVAYESIDIKEGDIFTTATYTATYTSELMGDITGEYTLIALCSGGKWQIEWAPNLIFPDMEWGDTVRVGTLAATRGEILADGNLLAATVGTVSVYASVSKIEDEALFVSQIAPLLNMTEEAVKKRLGTAYDDVAVLNQMYSDELEAYIKEQLLSIPGIGIDEGNFGTQREYPSGDMLAHILGYVGAISASSKEALQTLIDQMNEGRTKEDGLYNSDSRVGKLGLEKQYEPQLRGNNGYRIYISTSTGTNRRTLYTKPVQNGYDLGLTINYKLQKRLDFVLDSVLYGDTTAGAVVVMNPITGAIEAMASWPGYDLNAFTRGISVSDYNALTSKANTPLYNRLTQGQYPPGSVLKAFTATAALQAGTLDQNYVFTGNIEDDYWLPNEYGTWTGSKIKRAQVKYGRLSPLNLRSAIVHSDNIFFANAALMMGWDTFSSYFKSIGLDESIPFDLNVASAQIHNEDAEQSLMLLAESGYGQGEILMTPLQMAATFCAFANGGNIMVPYIVDGVYETEGIKYNTISKTPPTVWKQGAVSQQALNVLLPDLKDVVDRSLNGTGRRLKVTDVTIAAKTGTAEIGNDKSREIAWFAGFRCDVEDKDARLVLVMLEIPNSSEYSTLKFDIARELLKMSAP